MFWALYDRCRASYLIAATIASVALAGPAQAEQASAAGGSTFADNRSTYAADLTPDIGAAERIAAASRMRTLTQDLSAAACHLHHGLAPAEGRRKLVQARREMGHLLHALEFGNVAFGMSGAEDRRTTLAKIHDVRAVWEPVRGLITDLLDNPEDAAAMEQLDLFNDYFFETTRLLLAEVSGQYSHPFELLQVDALMIDIAGLQGMLTQKAAALSCRLRVNGPDQTVQKDLDATLKMLDLGVAALQDGMPELGILPAPTHEIDRTLAAFRSEWDGLRAELSAYSKVGSSTDPDRPLLVRISVGAALIEKTARLYMLHAKRNS